MILPSKGISPDRSILGIGGDLLDMMDAPIGVSTLWVRYMKRRKRLGLEAPVTFDWYVLALDFLFMIGAIGLDDKGRLVKRHVS